jgi:hypothetical protein
MTRSPDTPLRSRGAVRPRCAKNLPPKEGAGNAGRPVHPQPRVQSRKHTSVVTTSSPGLPGIPARNGFTAYFVLSPAIGLFCHRRQRIKALSTRSGSQNLR